MDRKNFFTQERFIQQEASIKSALEELLLKPGFKDKLHGGPTYSSDGNMCDICDGDFFKSFKSDNN